MKMTIARGPRRLASPFILSLAIAMSFPGVVTAQSANVPLRHWAYNFIDRLETRGLFVSEGLSTRPYPRDTFAAIIRQVSQSITEDGKTLSRTEGELFEQLKGEFHEELAGDAAVEPGEKEPHAFSWQTEEINSHFDVLFSEQVRLESKQPADAGVPRSITSLGIEARVNLKRNLVIFVNGTSTVLSEIDSLTNTIFNPSLGVPVTEKAFVDVAIADNATAYVVLRTHWFDFELGRDLVEWGPGFRGNLLLSRNSNVYDLLKLSFRYKKANFEYFHGFLNAERSKYITAHRLEIRPSASVQLAISESVVYGDRSVEPLYLNPFVPFIIAERHVGNKDNNMVSIDGTWFWREKGVKFYSEIFFDDFSLAKDLFGNFGNKWAILAGGLVTDPFGLPDTDVRFEVVRIQPFSYSHRFPRNTYSNYNNTIGHWLGPDTDDLYLELAHQVGRELRLAISVEQRRKGQNDINQGEPPEDGRTKFLGGIVERNRYYGLSADWQFRRDWFVAADYQIIQAKNLQNRAGINQTNHRLFLRLNLNF